MDTAFKFLTTSTNGVFFLQHPDSHVSARWKKNHLYSRNFEKIPSNDKASHFVECKTFEEVRLPSRRILIIDLIILWYFFLVKISTMYLYFVGIGVL